MNSPTVLMHCFLYTAAASFGDAHVAQQHCACILLISMHGCYPHLQGQAIRYGLQPHPLCHSQSAVNVAVWMQLAPRVAAEASLDLISASGRT